MRWQTIPYFSFFYYVCAMFILLAKCLDALLSILGPRSLNRKGPHLSRYKLVSEPYDHSSLCVIGLDRVESSKCFES